MLPLMIVLMLQASNPALSRTISPPLCPQLQLARAQIQLSIFAVRLLRYPVVIEAHCMGEAGPIHSPIARLSYIGTNAKSEEVFKTVWDPGKIAFLQPNEVAFYSAHEVCHILYGDVGMGTVPLKAPGATEQWEKGEPDREKQMNSCAMDALKARERDVVRAQAKVK